MILDVIKVFILSLVEGLTEFIPVSSTGHMILVDHFIKLSSNKEFVDSFMVIIQLGAILSVLVYYFPRLWPFSKDKEKNKEKWNMWIKIIVAVLPAVVLGGLFDDILEEKFFNALTVSIMLIFYGVILIIIESRKKRTAKISTINELSFKTAIGIGFFSMFSYDTRNFTFGSYDNRGSIIGIGKNFSYGIFFFLAIPTMFGATIYKIMKTGINLSSYEVFLISLGFVLSFIVSYIVIRVFLDYIKNHDFKIFGYYRIVLGIIMLVFIFVTK